MSGVDTGDVCRYSLVTSEAVPLHVWASQPSVAMLEDCLPQEEEDLVKHLQPRRTGWSTLGSPKMQASLGFECLPGGISA